MPCSDLFRLAPNQAPVHTEPLPYRGLTLPLREQIHNPSLFIRKPAASRIEQSAPLSRC